MVKKTEPSPAYLKVLEGDLATAQYEFQMAKVKLYRYTATAKLGESEFETARKQCLDAVAKIDIIEREINRVRKAI